MVGRDTPEARPCPARPGPPGLAWPARPRPARRYPGPDLGPDPAEGKNCSPADARLVRTLVVKDLLYFLDRQLHGQADGDKRCAFHDLVHAHHDALRDRDRLFQTTVHGTRVAQSPGKPKSDAAQHGVSHKFSQNGYGPIAGEAMSICVYVCTYVCMCVWWLRWQ